MQTPDICTLTSVQVTRLSTYMWCVYLRQPRHIPYTLVLMGPWHHSRGSRGARIRGTVLLTTVSIWSELFLENIRPRPFSISFDDYSQHPIEREGSRRWTSRPKLEGQFAARVALTKGPLAQILQISIPTTDILISAAADFPNGNSNKGRTKPCPCLFPLISVWSFSKSRRSRGSAIIGRNDRNNKFIVDSALFS